MGKKHPSPPKKTKHTHPVCVNLTYGKASFLIPNLAMSMTLRRKTTSLSLRTSTSQSKTPASVVAKILVLQSKAKN